jgi:hypothetical protein
MKKLAAFSALLAAGCTTITVNGVELRPSHQAAILTIGAIALALTVDRDPPAENWRLGHPETGDGFKPEKVQPLP